MWFFIIVVFVILLVLVGGFLVSKQCPQCKKLGLQRIEVEEIDRHTIKQKVKNVKRDSDGKVVSTTEKYIPVTKIRYKITYKCKHCGNEVTEYKEAER